MPFTSLLRQLSWQVHGIATNAPSHELGPPSLLPSCDGFGEVQEKTHVKEDKTYRELRDCGGGWSRIQFNHS